jgi:hypothetical protein
MRTSVRLYHWLPRILGILAILFISLFAADAFAPGLTIWQQLGAFLIHLIPSFILLAFLFIAWKWEFIGGIIFMVVGLAFTPVIFMLNYNRNDSIWLSLIIILTITIPFVVVGILFLISHRLKKKSLPVK